MAELEGETTLFQTATFEDMSDGVIANPYDATTRYIWDGWVCVAERQPETPGTDA